jgi:hypothetical protein
LFSIIPFFKTDLYCALNLRNVSLVGALVGGRPEDVCVRGNYAYVAAGGVFYIILKNA